MNSRGSRWRRWCCQGCVRHPVWPPCKGWQRRRGAEASIKFKYYYQRLDAWRRAGTHKDGIASCRGPRYPWIPKSWLRSFGRRIGRWPRSRSYKLGWRIRTCWSRTSRGAGIISTSSVRQETWENRWRLCQTRIVAGLFSGQCSNHCGVAGYWFLQW